MIAPSKFYNELVQSGVSFFTGVPDSLLKSVCAYISEVSTPDQHIIAANEGASIGLATGHYLASGELPLVYMQNSGLGNIINPLMSIADKEVYSIPMILMIGWRGEPGVKDEPQHIKQGKVTLATLEAMGIPYSIIDGNEPNALQEIKKATSTAKESSCAYALIVKKDSFEKYSLDDSTPGKYPYNREQVIQKIAAALADDDVIVSTTGMASRELFEYRTKNNQGHAKDFLTVGGMGHASQIALGVALKQKNRRVICIDGDGAAIMHLGSLAINGQNAGENYKHIVINNGAHDSVGGQPTVAFDIDFVKIADACGYGYVATCDNAAELNHEIAQFLNSKSSAFLEIKVNKGNRKDLGRPTTTPKENKSAFMQNLQAQ